MSTQHLLLLSYPRRTFRLFRVHVPLPWRSPLSKEGRSKKMLIYAFKYMEYSFSIAAIGCTAFKFGPAYSNSDQRSNPLFIRYLYADIRGPAAYIRCIYTYTLIQRIYAYTLVATLQLRKAVNGFPQATTHLR